MFEDNKDEKKPKMVEVMVTKAGASDSMSPDKLKVKHDLLNKVKSMALKAMKDQMDCDSPAKASDEMEDMMDPMEMAEESDHESKDSEDKEVEMLPENPGDSKQERLATLLKEMEDLTNRVKQMLEA
jgi:hypothetical protein